MDDNEYRFCERAQAMLGDPDIDRVLEAMQAGYIDEWKETHDPEMREMLWHRVGAVGDFKRALQVAADAKKIRDKEIANEATKKK